ncbi:MAG: hypothetical protein R3F33_11710 [Planctomycetota bacterium]
MLRHLALPGALAALAPCALSQVDLLTTPLAETAYCKAQFPDNVDRFGSALAVDGHTMVVGAYLEDSAATGLNGNAADNTRPEAGAAYIFERFGNHWSQVAYLKQASSVIGTGFGYSTAISGDWVAVGYPGDSSQLASAGSVYMYRRVNGAWFLYQIVTADFVDFGDSFGYSVAIDGDTLVVGAVSEDSDATGVNGDRLNNNASQSGAAYVFHWDGLAWQYGAYLKASNTDATDFFGSDVSVLGDRVAVTARGEASSAGGVDGDQLLNDMDRAGAVYVFDFDGTTWAQSGYIKASYPGLQDEFGIGLALGVDRLYAGSGGEDGEVGGDGSLDTLTDSGAVYEYVFGTTGWEFARYIKPSSLSSSDRFGNSLALDGNRLMVAASGNDSKGTEIGNDPTDNSAGDSGGVYLFDVSVDPPLTQVFLKSSNSDPVDQFGTKVALSGDVYVASAMNEASLAGSLNPDPSDNSGNLVGAVYVFQNDVAIATFCGPALPNSTGPSAQIGWSGSTTLTDADFHLLASNLPSDQFGYFLNSTANGWYAYPGGSEGILCIGGGPSPIGRHIADLASSGPSGTLDVPLDLTQLPTPTVPYTVLAGEVWFFQCWFRDMHPTSTSNFTNGLIVRFE